jgi:prephenate dehydrogenase
MTVPEPASIVVVGGMGGMGSTFVRFFRDAGYRVEVADAAAGPVPWRAVGRHQVIILAVPMAALREVLVELGPFTVRGGVVIDLTSLKAEPVRWMVEHCRGEVVGAHPLFGPDTLSPEGHTLFLCPGRGTGWISWFRGFFERLGVRVVKMDPDDHDRLMARVQVLRHLLLTCFGRSLELLDFDMESDLPICGPWFGRLVELLRRQFTQSPRLYSEIALNNPYTAETLAAMNRAIAEVSAWCRSRDVEGLERLMSGVADFAGRDGTR